MGEGQAPLIALRTTTATPCWLARSRARTASASGLSINQEGPSGNRFGPACRRTPKISPRTVRTLTSRVRPRSRPSEPSPTPTDVRPHPSSPEFSGPPSARPPDSLTLGLSRFRGRDRGWNRDASVHTVRARKRSLSQLPLDVPQQFSMARSPRVAWISSRRSVRRSRVTKQFVAASSKFRLPF